MEDINKLQHLLNTVSVISKKYEDIAKITGEKFNIFSVMNMESNERYTHSAVIGELLNPKGSHGQGNIYLKLFFSQIKCLRTFREFDFDNANVILEEHIGLIDEEYSKGGFIDIVIKDNVDNVILIENKIHAVDQKNQLIRYKNYYKNSILLYLNLFGQEPSKESSGNLEKEKDFYIINYQDDILNWLDKCQKESVDQPIIRETIKQYINLTKRLTNQTTNDAMSEEIIKVICKYPAESFEIANNISSYKTQQYILFMENIKNYAEKNDIEINDSWMNNDKEYGLFLKPKKWIDNQISICVIFEKSNYRGLFYGVSYEKITEQNKTELREKFARNGFKENPWWIWKYVKDSYWEDNSEVWEDVSKGLNSKVFNEIIIGINEIIKIEKM